MCEGRVFDVGVVKVKAKWVPVKSGKELANKVYFTGKSDIDSGVEQAAFRLEGAIKSGISQAPNPASNSKSYSQLKEWAAEGIGVVSENYEKKRRKVFRGSTIPVYLVSTSPGGARSAFANTMLEFGRGRLPGYHPWLRALVNAGGKTSRNYLTQEK